VTDSEVVLPEMVRSADRLMSSLGFALSCEPEVGRLLATLAAAVPPDGRILELGTGAGVGTAWLASGLGSDRPAELVTVERDKDLAAAVKALDWETPPRFVVGDIEEVLPTLGRFDLIFADAEGGKWTGLDLTIEALRPGGVLVVDDMDPTRYTLPEHLAAVAAVRETLLSDARLVATELATSTGLLLATRRRGALGTS
jgi:predicted O-methyltransferase YrrM